MQAIYIKRVESVLLSLWVGGICTIGYLVAPVLFFSLPDKDIAAQIAGKLFSVSAVVGLYLGTMVLLLQLVGSSPLKRFWWIIPVYIVAEVFGRFTSFPGAIPALIYLGVMIVVFRMQGQGGMLRIWQPWLTLFMLLSTAVAYFYFTPAIEAMRQSGEAARASAHFKAMHGSASILYLLTSMSGLAQIFVINKTNDL